jgi:radial spoke head protein 4A
LNPSSWVHHVPYILPQGRVTWENPTPKKGGRGEDGDGDGGDGDDDDAGNDDDQDDSDKDPTDAPLEPESGPAILSPLSNDDDDVTDGTPSWVSRTCSMFSPAKFAPVTLRSTRWPGASIVAFNDKFANIYVGDGHRDVGVHVPPVLALVQKEFVLMEKSMENEDDDGAAMRPVDIVEQRDPTVEEEVAFEEAKKAKEEEGKGDDEDGGGSDAGGDDEDE